MRRPRHAELYAATASIHRQTEHTVEKAQFLTSRARYIDYLRRMRAFYAVFQDSAVGHGKAQLEAWRILDRANWLDKDIADLNAPPPGQEKRVLAAGRLDLDTPAALLGGLYVLVGSTLGAPILLHRTTGLDLPAGSGRAYLSGVASQRCWPSFLIRLEAEPRASAPQMVTGAVSTFECLLDHMSGACP